MDSIDPLLTQLTTIKWLLVFIAVCAFGLVATFFILASTMIGAIKAREDESKTQSKIIELEELLAKGQSKAAKFMALELVTVQPQRVEAHWALAKAHYQLDELSEAKQALNKLLKIAPEEHYRVDAWLDLLETEFSEKRPKPVA